MKYSFSIVSHNHQHLCKAAIASIIKNIRTDFEIILTLNIKEKLILPNSWNTYLKIIQNSSPLGFGENHNNAHKSSNGEYFVIVNPDIEIHKWNEENFNSKTLYSPVILNIDGTFADYKRSYPSITNLFRRKILGNKTEKLDWFAGVFLIIKSTFFKELKGFDQDFFMYLEDTDLSLRVKEKGGKLEVINSISIFHDARRSSNKNLKFLRYHVSSLLKFYSKHIHKVL